MIKLLYLIVIVLLIGCNESSEKQRINVIEESKFKFLLEKYRDIKFDTLKVFSGENLESNMYKIKGKQLDSADVSLLPDYLAEQYIYDTGYFACYKFPIDKTLIGLITRIPSTYEPSSIRLLIFDRQKDKITDQVELAETFGDAGDMMEKTSWLFRESNLYKAFIRVDESHDHGVDDQQDTTIESWNYYYLLDLSRSKVDTINKNEKDLKKRFASLIYSINNHN